jgi:AraC family transcriptional regulator
MQAPSEVPKFVPGAVTAASDDLGWNGVWLRGYRYSALDVIVPPVRDFTIVSYCRGATFMERQCEGAWTKTHCAPGDVSLLKRALQIVTAILSLVPIVTGLIAMSGVACSEN